MALINPINMIKAAQDSGYAIAAFNIHNMETIQAVVEGAWEEHAPVIIQTTPGTLKHAGIPYIVAMVRAAADIYDIPIALHLDHCDNISTIIQCIRNGYTSVMIDGSKLPYKQNVEIVGKVVEIAHYAGVAVEGELGKIGGTEDDLVVHGAEATFTVPNEARNFVDSTNIDTLAVAIGTAHGVYKGEPKLDFERLSEIKKMVDIPLVLHGASGVPDESIKNAVNKGICKINIATELKIPMAQAIQQIFSKKPQETDPRKYMGYAKEAVKDVVRSKIKLCGASGRAWEDIR